MSIQELGSELREQGLSFVEQLKKSRKLSCVQGHFTAFLGKSVLAEAKKLAEDSPEKKAQMIQFFREGIRELYSISKGWDHVFYKPFGYPGDFAALEVVYNQSAHPESSSALAALIDEWTTSTSLAAAVRSRKDALRVFLEKAISEHIEKNNSQAPLQALSIASGGAREIREIHSPLIQQLEISLLDQDPRALEYAFSCLSARTAAPKVHKILANIFKFDASQYFSQEDSFDLIYSFGLFDYLSDEALIACSQKFLPYLKAGGKFVFCLKDHRFFDSWFYDWCFDWKFVPRTSEDANKLLEQMNLNLIDTLKVEGSVVSIYVCQKKR